MVFRPFALWTSGLLLASCALLPACARHPSGRLSRPLASSPANAQPLEAGTAHGKANPPSQAPPASAYRRYLHTQLGEATLGLDAPLQDAAETALAEDGGRAAVLAFRVRDGQVLALASSHPGAPGDPLLTAHHPASTFKAFAGLAALEQGVLSWSDRKRCSGKHEHQGEIFTCFGKHGEQNLADALARSCNGFFYEVAESLPQEALPALAERLGVGKPTGLELPEELGSTQGAVRPDWRPLLDAIGHGSIRLTLPQLARAYARMLNGGPVPLLHLRQQQQQQQQQLRPAPQSQDHALRLREALRGTIERPDGTAHSLELAGLPVSGKTGTESNSGHQTFNGWFVGWLGPPNQAVVVAARAEQRKRLAAQRAGQIAAVLFRQMGASASLYSVARQPKAAASPATAPIAPNRGELQSQELTP